MHVRKTKQKITLMFCQTFYYDHPKEIKTILSEVVRQHQLKGVRCTWILQPEQYQLLQTEALPVPPNEFQGAIRWKVKDLLRFPLEDAVIDSFPMPRAKLPTALNMIMLVVARLSILKPLREQITTSGLKLTTIDIPELGFRNLTAWYEKDEKSTGLLYLQEESSQLLVTHQQKLYFTRSLDFGLQALQSAAVDQTKSTALDQLMNEAVLNIQRSFDYYQSQWRQPEPARIFLAMGAPCTVDVAALLSQRLEMAVNKMDLDAYFDNQAQMNLKQDGYFLPLLGGILREWEPSYAAGN